jgi:hypothetical protein
VSLETTKDLAIVAGTVVALTTFLTGVLEFYRQSHHRRVEYFIDMRRRFLETPLFQEMLRLIATDDPALRQIPVQDRRNFGGFFEEVALLVSSRLISREVAHYMFGHYVLLTARSENFWDGLDRYGTYWKLFNAFAREMEEIAHRPVVPAKLRF